jgi:hypothetical protein
MQIAVCESEDLKVFSGFLRCSDWSVIDATQTEMLINGGFSQEAFLIGFSGVLTLWAAGLGAGLIVGVIRKLKNG